MGVITSLILIHCSAYLDYNGCVSDNITCVNRNVTKTLKEVLKTEEQNTSNDNDIYARAYLACMRKVSNNCNEGN